jgi:hypothetical protein
MIAPKHGDSKTSSPCDRLTGSHRHRAIGSPGNAVICGSDHAITPSPGPDVIRPPSDELTSSATHRVTEPLSDSITPCAAFGRTGADPGRRRSRRSTRRDLVDGSGDRRRTRKSLAPRRPPNSDCSDSREQARGSGADAHDTAVVAGERQVGKTEDNYSRPAAGSIKMSAPGGPKHRLIRLGSGGRRIARERATCKTFGMPANGGVSGVIDAVMDETGSSRGREARQAGSRQQQGDRQIRVRVGLQVARFPPNARRVGARFWVARPTQAAASFRQSLIREEARWQR